MNFARDTVCNFLEVETKKINPDTWDIDVMSFDQAYSMLIKQGYLLNTYVKMVNGKAIFHADIFEKIRGNAIEIRTGYSVNLVPWTPEEVAEEPVDAADIPETVETVNNTAITESVIEEKAE